LNRCKYNKRCHGLSIEKWLISMRTRTFFNNKINGIRNLLLEAAQY